MNALPMIVIARSPQQRVTRQSTLAFDLTPRRGVSSQDSSVGRELARAKHRWSGLSPRRFLTPLVRFLATPARVEDNSLHLSYPQSR